jgi:hypothetical protein
MSKVNWTILRNEYVTDESVSFSTLSAKYKISETAIAVRSSKEKWQELRKIALEKINSKLTEKTTETIASFQADKLKAGKYMVSVGLKGIQSHAPRNARESREIIDSGYKIATEALGLDNPKIAIQNNNIQNNIMSLDDFMRKMKDGEHTGTISTNQE